MQYFIVPLGNLLSQKNEGLWYMIYFGTSISRSASKRGRPSLLDKITQFSTINIWLSK